MNQYDALLLQNHLSFSMYACSREMIKRCRAGLDALGLTYTQYITMMVVWECSECSVKTLGEKLYLDSGTLTPVVITDDACEYRTYRGGGAQLVSYAVNVETAQDIVRR